MTDIDGTLHYDLTDVRTGLCSPDQLWKPVPADALPPPPVEVEPPPVAEPTPAQMRKDVLAAYKKLGGVEYLTVLAAESPPAFLKLLTSALHQADLPAGIDPAALDREQIRQMQMADCLAVIAAHRPASLAGDAKASEVIIKAQDRLAKLAGTDQPRLVATFNGGSISALTDAELEAIARGQTLTLQEDGTYAAPDGD